MTQVTQADREAAIKFANAALRNWSLADVSEADLIDLWEAAERHRIASQASLQETAKDAQLIIRSLMYEAGGLSGHIAKREDGTLVSAKIVLQALKEQSQ